MPLTSHELAEEHRLVSDLSHALASRASARRGAKDVETLERLIDALDACLVAVHIVKEERALFPLLQARGLPRDHAVIAALLHQHESARVYLRRLRDGCAAVRRAEHGAAAALSVLAREFNELLREHVRIEDQYFYDLAQRQLQPGDGAALAQAFAMLDRATGGEAVRENARRALGRPTRASASS